MKEYQIDIINLTISLLINFLTNASTDRDGYTRIVRH